MDTRPNSDISKSSALQNGNLQNLFLAKLPRNINDSDLLHLFREYNPQSAKVMLDAASGKSKGFGFVLFDTAEQGAIAFEAMNHRHVAVHNHSFTLHIFPSKHDGKTAAVESNALFIRNIPMTVTHADIHNFLARFGPLICCSLRPDNRGHPVWVVFAEFESVASATAALRTLHGSTSYFGATVPILAKYQDSDEAKEQRRERRRSEDGIGRANVRNSPQGPNVAPRPKFARDSLPPPRWHEVVRDGKFIADANDTSLHQHRMSSSYDSVVDAVQLQAPPYHSSVLPDPAQPIVPFSPGVPPPGNLAGGGAFWVPPGYGHPFYQPSV